LETASTISFLFTRKLHGKDATPMKFSHSTLLRNSLAVLILLFAVYGHGHAALLIPQTPEIDPSLTAGGLALLGGAILLVRGRRRR
jgi:LPXTG-motif cell wall-anchored protein